MDTKVFVCRGFVHIILCPRLYTETYPLDKSLLYIRAFVHGLLYSGLLYIKGSVHGHLFMLFSQLDFCTL